MAAATASATSTEPFALLADPATYRACTFDYYSTYSRPGEPPVTLESWIEVFRKSIPTFKSHAARDTSVPDAKQRAERFAESFARELDRVLSEARQQPGGSQPPPPVNCATLCHLRERCLRDAGFTDIFKEVKDTENEAALQLLPQVLGSLDAQPGRRAALEHALRGVFAGNIFDLGAAASAERYEAGQGAGFHCALDQLLPRPWVIDDLDDALDALAGPPGAEGPAAPPRYSKALMFVDNAGADVLLGMLPFARELLKAGTKVMLAANDGPTINDVTARELSALVAAAAERDEAIASAWASGALRVAANGSDLPVIDLSAVGPLAEAAEGVDLLVLEGMGRAIETNLLASFTVDALKLGMIKHPEVAVCLGGRLYDCVCRFDRRSEAAGRAAARNAQYN